MSEEVRAKLTLDTEEAQTEARGFFGNVLGPGAANAAAAIGLVTAAVGTVVGVLEDAIDITKELIELSDVQEKAERRLIQAASARAQSTRGLLKEQREWAFALQQFTGIGDEVTLGLQAQLLHLGVYREELEVVTLAALGFADAHQKDVASSIAIVGRVAQGEVSALKRYGGAWNSAGDALAYYAEQGLAAADRSDQLGTQLSILDSNWSDFLELLGSTITESDGVRENLQTLSFRLLDFSNWVSDHKDEITTFWDSVAEKVRFLADNADIAFDVLTGNLSGAAGKAINKALADDVDPTGGELPQGLRDLERRMYLEFKLREEFEQKLEALRERLRRKEEENAKRAEERRLQRLEQQRAREEARLERMNRAALKKLEREAKQREREKERIHRKEMREAERRAREKEKQQKEQARRSREIQKDLAAGIEGDQRFVLSIFEQLAHTAVDIQRQMIDQLVENAINGETVSGKAIAGIIGEMMIAQGWGFQQQAIALTFEAIANSGSTAWRAIAMGAAAKVMLLGGYAMKAFAGRGRGGGPSGGSSIPASASAGADRFRGSNPSTAGRAPSDLDRLHRERVLGREGNGSDFGGGSRGAAGFGEAAPITNVTNVYLREGFVYGTEEGLGRAVRRVQRAADRLRGGGP